MKKMLCLAVCFCLFSNCFCVNALGVSAKAAVVINGDTGEILYSFNCNERLPMASTTKIMTALLLCELGGDLSQEIVATNEMVTVEGSSMGLIAGDTVSYRDLLYGMMLSSGNDAANTTAIAIGGSIENFVDLMNKRAKELGLVDTNFVTPSGLDSEEHYTTAYELALITKAALSNEEFAAAASSESARLCYGNPPYNRTLTNHNKLLKMYDDVIGVKTGFTKKSGRCLVSASKNNGKFVIAVTLNDKNDWEDHRNLLDIGLSLVSSKTFSPSSDVLNLPLVCGGSVSASIPSTSLNVTENSSVSFLIQAPPFLYPPIYEGKKIGEISYLLNGTEICSVDIKADAAVQNKTSKLKLFYQIFINMFSQI